MKHSYKIGNMICSSCQNKVRKASKDVQYICPMHPEIIKNEPRDCPICGMNLIPVEHSEEEENMLYHTLLKKFKVAVIFTIFIFIITMSEMVTDNPLHQLMVMGVPIAAGLLYPFLGLLLSLMLATLAMSFSSVSVIINALRLRRIKL